MFKMRRQLFRTIAGTSIAAYAKSGMGRHEAAENESSVIMLVMSAVFSRASKHQCLSACLETSPSVWLNINL